MLLPGSTPAHNRQTDPAADPSPGNKKGGSYLALRFSFLNSFGEELPHYGGPADHLALCHLIDFLVDFS
ncbi:MAG: hypothetical protein ORN83_06620 [Chthoniobacteraceae bacterium]|nr:hypothetical protein [Chthoniobacteraceae bacterium]